MVTSPICMLPAATSMPASTVITARPRLRITAWAPFSRESEVLAFTAAPT